MLSHSCSCLLISIILLLSLCEAAVATEKAATTATIPHKVRMTYTSIKDRDEKLQVLLARWKSILAQPDLGRTVTDIKLWRDKAQPEGHLVLYEVTYTKANKKNPAVLVSKAKAAVDDSLGQRPIAGFSVIPTRHSDDVRSLMAFDILE